MFLRTRARHATYRTPGASLPMLMSAMPSRVEDVPGATASSPSGGGALDHLAIDAGGLISAALRLTKLDKDAQKEREVSRIVVQGVAGLIRRTQPQKSVAVFIDGAEGVWRAARFRAVTGVSRRTEQRALVGPGSALALAVENALLEALPDRRMAPAEVIVSGSCTAGAVEIKCARWAHAVAARQADDATITGSISGSSGGSSQSTSTSSAVAGGSSSSLLAGDCHTVAFAGGTSLYYSTLLAPFRRALNLTQSGNDWKYISRAAALQFFSLEHADGSRPAWLHGRSEAYVMRALQDATFLLILAQGHSGLDIPGCPPLTPIAYDLVGAYFTAKASAEAALAAQAALEEQQHQEGEHHHHAAAGATAGASSANGPKGSTSRQEKAPQRRTLKKQEEKDVDPRWALEPTEVCLLVPSTSSGGASHLLHNVVPSGVDAGAATPPTLRLDARLLRTIFSLIPGTPGAARVALIDPATGQPATLTSAANSGAAAESNATPPVVILQPAASLLSMLGLDGAAASAAARAHPPGYSPEVAHHLDACLQAFHLLRFGAAPNPAFLPAEAGGLVEFGGAAGASASPAGATRGTSALTVAAFLGHLCSVELRCAPLDAVIAPVEAPKPREALLTAAEFALLSIGHAPSLATAASGFIGQTVSEDFAAKVAAQRAPTAALGQLRRALAFANPNNAHRALCHSPAVCLVEVAGRDGDSGGRSVGGARSSARGAPAGARVGGAATNARTVSGSATSQQAQSHWRMFPVDV